MKSSEFKKLLLDGTFANMVKETIKGTKINDDRVAYNIIKPFLASYESDREHFVTIFMNAKNEILKIEVLFTGTINSSTIYTREFIKKIFKYEAIAVIIAHNHPSGGIEPSEQDNMLTKNLYNLCKMLDICLYDHLIIGNDNYYSYQKSVGLNNL